MREEVHPPPSPDKQKIKKKSSEETNSMHACYVTESTIRGAFGGGNKDYRQAHTNSVQLLIDAASFSRKRGSQFWRGNPHAVGGTEVNTHHLKSARFCLARRSRSTQLEARKKRLEKIRSRPNPNLQRSGQRLIVSPAGPKSIAARCDSHFLRSDEMSSSTSSRRSVTQRN